MSINNPIQDVIDRIKSDLEKLEHEVAPTRSDLADPNTKQQKAKELDAFFVDRINLFKDADFGVGLPENNNWEYPVLERRKIALLHLFAEAQERLGDKYPELDIADQLVDALQCALVLGLPVQIILPGALLPQQPHVSPRSGHARPIAPRRIPRGP